MFDFVFNYALPVVVFAYCYSRIFGVIRRQKKVVAVNQDVAMATTSRDRNAGQVHLQEAAGPSGAKTGGKLSRTQLNVLQTMVAVIVCFIVCWTPGSLANAVQAIKVCRCSHVKPE